MAFASDKGRQGAAGVSTGYDIDNSLRFNDDDSAYLSRTPSSAGNRKTWTWSGWVKRGNINTSFQILFGAEINAGTTMYIGLHSDNNLRFQDGSTTFFDTSALLRDTSAWYNIIVAFDTTQATASDRVKVYINGVEITSFSSSTNPSLNTDYTINNSVAHTVGRWTPTDLYHFDGYLAEVHFIDGQALDPTSFGETGDYGEWKPIAYAGTYGTNGFYLDFKNSGSLGNDANGSNNWTPNNLAATDQMLDSPTNNFCTLNVVNQVGSSLIISEGNTNFFPSTSTGTRAIESSMSAPSSGKYYFEICTVSKAQGNWNYGGFGLKYTDSSLSSSYSYGGAGTNYVFANLYHNSNYGDIGTRANFWTNTNQPATLTVFQVAVDSDNDKIYLGKNNTWYGSADPANNTGTAWLNGGFGSGGMSFYFSGTLNQEMMVNFGQDSSFAGNKTAQGNQDSNSIGDFYYTPPSGFLALCTSNLPDPAVIPSEHFNTVLYTGTGVNNHAITGVGFQPDFLWIKQRGTTDYHWVNDAVRGATNNLYTNVTNAEAGINGGIKAFNTDGFTVGTEGGVNDNTGSFVAWNWKANGTGVSNTNGSITSTVSANADAGFSIVSWTGDGGSSTTLGHGLSSAPEMVILKGRDGEENWLITTKPESTYTYMNFSTGGDQAGGDEDYFPDGFASTVFTPNNNGSAWSNGSGSLYIAYCFHSVDGYSKVGSYTGNGSTDGTFVHCGFRPAYVMVKRTNASENWAISDGARSEYNAVDAFLRADESTAESSAAMLMDFTSNGFKMRNTDTKSNGNGDTYIYLAFAETPFKYTNAR